jgi:hypothetical protein
LIQADSYFSVIFSLCLSWAGRRFNRKTGGVARPARKSEGSGFAGHVCYSERAPRSQLPQATLRLPVSIILLSKSVVVGETAPTFYIISRPSVLTYILLIGTPDSSQ